MEGFEEYQTVVLAALLHDIGKIVQRAQKEPLLKRHQEWGKEWLESLNLNNIAPFSMYHHRLSEDDFKAAELSIDKTNVISAALWMVYEADNLAIGEENWNEEWNKAIPLTSIFWKLRLSEKSREDYKDKENPWGYSAKPFTEKITFPSPNAAITSEGYSELLNGFENEVKRILQTDSLDPDSLLQTMETWFSFIPSETAFSSGSHEKNPDVSLYDHARLTGAITACMFRYWSMQEGSIAAQSKDEILNRADSRYLLVGGDISGIQDFIYTITYKAALKGLRGRSFYLELLTEHITSSLLKRLRLPRCNIIYQGGGTFLIIAPNTEESKRVITDLRNNLNRWLFDEHNGKLFVAIDWIALCGHSFTNYSPCPEHPGVVEAWSKILRKLDVQKSQRFSGILKQEDFIPRPLKGLPCDICKKLGSKARAHFKDKDTDEVLTLCDACYSLTLLGEKLPYSKFIGFSETPLQKDNANCVSIKIENDYWTLHNDEDKRYEKLYELNPVKRKGETHIFYAGIHPEAGVEFNEIVKEGLGAEYLGSLRMDVDNLGILFSQGLPQNLMTFSRLATLSRLLNIFFKRYINDIASASSDINPLRLNVDKSGERDIVIVYSGGDDLFITGAWSEVVEASFDIHRAFKQYTCKNPDIGLSAGLVLTKPNLPIYRIASYAGDAERISKSIKDKFGRKDGASLFYSLEDALLKESVSLKWDDWEEMMVYIKAFLTLGEFNGKAFKPEFSKVLLFRLIQSSEEWKKRKHFTIPKVAYALARAQKKEKEWLEDSEKLKAWSLIVNNILDMEFLRRASRPIQWIELLIRGGD